MNARYVAEDAGKILGGFAVTGLLLGALVGVMKERARMGGEATIHTSMPARVAVVPELKDNLLLLAKVKTPNKDSLQRVIRRCDGLLELFIVVDGAAPHTVKPSLSAAASSMEASIAKYMLEFYALSNVALTHEREGARPHHLVPVNRDLREADMIISLTVQGIAHELKKRVKDKLELKSAEASGRRAEAFGT